jgi:hypothetical protein
MTSGSSGAAARGSSFHDYIRSVSWLRWLFETKQGEIVIMQVPNVPLILALVADLVAYLTAGQVHEVSNWIARALFAVWALMEIGWGVNPFRRMLGAIVLALVGFAAFRH